MTPEDEEMPLVENEPLLKDLKKKERKGFIGTADQYIPELVDTEFILTGWRCNYRSKFEVFMTLFKWHNETMNVWTHLLGALLAFFAIVIIYVSYPNMMQDA